MQGFFYGGFMQYFIENQFVSEDKASIHVHDLGLLRGYGVYECFRCYGKTPFYLEEHLTRFFDSSHDQSLPVPYSRAELLEIINTLIRKNNCNDLVFKIFLTAGSSEDHITYNANTRLIIICHAFKPIDEAFYKRGFRVQPIIHERHDPHIKTTAYAAGIKSVFHAKKQGFDDCMYMDRDKNMLELTTSNLFFVKQNKLITPSEKILFGMTRLVAIKIAHTLGISVEQRRIVFDELSSFDEVFCTSTLKKILPVTKIGSQGYTIGPISKKFILSFDKLTQKKESVCC